MLQRLSAALRSDALVQDTHYQRKPILCERLDQLLLLVPPSLKQASWLAQLREDRPNYEKYRVNGQLSIAWNLAVLMLFVTCLISGVERLVRSGSSLAWTARSLGLSVSGLGYLLVLVSSPLARTQRYSQKLTSLVLLVQCLTLLVAGAFSYRSDSEVVLVVTIYSAYVLFIELCTFMQRMTICFVAVSGYFVTSMIACGSGVSMDVVENMGFLITFVTFMTFSLRLQDHLQHVSCFQQRRILKRVEKSTEAKKLGSRLLNNMIPPHVVDLLRKGVSPIAEHHDNVTIIVTDIKGFTKFAAAISLCELVNVLNSMYSAFDEIITKWELHRVEIIGDAYVISAGCPPTTNGISVDASEWATRAVEVALALQRTLPSVCNDNSVQMRVGIHTGSVVAGVVGKKGPRYHLFGKDVGYAEQMESTCVPGHVQISEATHRTLEEGGRSYRYEERQVHVEEDDALHRTWIVTGSNLFEAAAIQKKLIVRRRRHSNLIGLIAGACSEQ